MRLLCTMIQQIIQFSKKHYFLWQNPFWQEDHGGLQGTALEI